MNLRHPAYIIGFMVGAAALVGAAVTGLTLATRPLVERNQALGRQQALLRLFRLADPDRLTVAEVNRLVQSRIDETRTLHDPETGWETPLIQAYADDARTQVAGYAIRFRGLGFWAPIEGLLAISADRQKTIGLVILAHTETPGLGGRIAEPIFTDQFAAGLNLQPPPGGKPLYLTATAPEPGTPAHGRSILAITGATQTCMAMERILNAQVTRFQRAMAVAAPAPAAPQTGGAR